MRIEFYRDRRGEWRWRVRARNGKIMADGGEGYKRRRDCVSGAEKVVRPEVFASRVYL